MGLFKRNAKHHQRKEKTRKDVENGRNETGENEGVEDARSRRDTRYGFHNEKRGPRVEDP